MCCFDFDWCHLVVVNDCPVDIIDNELGLVVFTLDSVEEAVEFLEVALPD